MYAHTRHFVYIHQGSCGYTHSQTVDASRMDASIKSNHIARHIEPKHWAASQLIRERCLLNQHRLFAQCRHNSSSLHVLSCLNMKCMADSVLHGNTSVNLIKSSSRGGGI